MEDEKLIECVRQYPALYDVTNVKYVDCNYKLMLWKEISHEIHETDEACKKRWTNIRDQFKKTLRKRKITGGLAPDGALKRYKYEDNLQFLLPYIQEKTSTSNLDDQEEEIKNFELWPSDETALSNESQTQRNYFATDGNINLGDEVYKARHSSKKKLSEISPRSLMNHIWENNEGKYSENHPIDAFLNGLAPTLKNLPAYYQHLARGRIFSVVQELEAEAFFGSEQQVTTPPSSSWSEQMESQKEDDSSYDCK